MHRKTLEILICPSCRCRYECVAHAGDAQHVERGFLRCVSCATVIPIVDSFVMFTEPLLHEGLATETALEVMAQALFGSAEAFEAYRRDKLARNIVEAYAAFQPFNESQRALAPLLPHIRRCLGPGDFVLDCWARTGWSGEWLAGLLPDQHIVSIWEGNTSVLGYRGYRYLLGSAQRAANLDVVFTHPERPMPFRDQAFGLTYSMDSLHRYALFPFAGESLRVTRPDGALIHAHLHLTNSEPTPFFDRGCHQAHGRDYRAWLDCLTANGERRGFVFSEAALFDGPPTAPLEDDHDTGHYNALVAIFPAQPSICPPARETPRERWRYLVNPLFRIRLGRGVAEIAPRKFGGEVEHLLERHPVYAARLLHPVAIDETAILVLLLAGNGLDHSELLATMPEQPGAISRALDQMVRSELLLAAPLGPAAHALQGFHSNQCKLDRSDSPLAFWAQLGAQATSVVALPDGTELTGSDLAEFTARVPAALHTADVKPGDWLAVDVREHPLLWFTALAAADAGIHVRLIGDEVGDPAARLRLHGDMRLEHEGCMALGLDGRVGALLDRLARESAGAVPGNGDGLLEFRTLQGVVRCTFQRIAGGVAVLLNELEPQFWMLEGHSHLHDLITLLSGIGRGERIHFQCGLESPTIRGETGGGTRT